MKLRFKVAAFLILCILLTSCHAQTKANFQSVGGDFGRTWLKDFLAENPERQTKSQNSTTLWNWGGAPKGMMVQNGSLVADPYYYWRSLNYTSGWLGQAYVDPSIGYPVYAYVDPYTGYPDYFYLDPKTGKPVYVNAGAATQVPGYGSATPYYWPYADVPTSSNYPWLGDTSGLLPFGSAADYGGLGMV
jgi:hypothetical protein